jgi:hypothetical protein
MDAIALLDQQHKQVEGWFAKLDSAQTKAARQRLFEQIGDALAIHATIEEKVFYPAVFGEQTHDFLYEAVEEHLAAKRLIADLIDSPPDDNYVAKLNLLKEEVLHHIQEERKQLFPAAQRMLDAEALAALGEQMESMIAELESGEQPPRMHVPGEIEHAAVLP